MPRRKAGRSSSAKEEPQIDPEPQPETQAENVEITDNSEVVSEPKETPAAEPEPAPQGSDAAPSPEPNEYRGARRESVHVKAVVQFRESEEETWKEIVDITTISKNGAALLLSNSCPVGRLVSMALQMPTKLRVYDFTQDVYPMLGVVQNCSPISIDGKKVFHVGVAFIGKKMPDSYKADPAQSYRLIGRSPLGLWNVEETARAFQSRRFARFWRRFEVSLSVRDEEKKETIRQKAFTRDISIGGMSVWGPLDASIGDRVKVTSRDHDFFSMAVVRNRTENEKPGESMVHFEFEGQSFPIAKIDKPKLPGPDDANE